MMTTLLDQAPAFILSFGALLGQLALFRHRLARFTVFLAAIFSILWVVGISSLALNGYDLPFGNQTAGVILLVISTLSLGGRIVMGWRGFERIFVFAMMVSVLLTSILFHTVMYRVVGHYWMLDALAYADAPMRADEADRGRVCREYLYVCRQEPFPSSFSANEDGVLYVLRMHGIVVLDGSTGLYQYARKMMTDKGNYLAAYHAIDGELVEVKNTFHLESMDRVIKNGITALSISAGVVWIGGALFLISFHRRRLNGGRRLSAL